MELRDDADLREPISRVTSPMLSRPIILSDPVLSDPMLSASSSRGKWRIWRDGDDDGDEEKYDVELEELDEKVSTELSFSVTSGNFNSAIRIKSSLKCFSKKQFRPCFTPVTLHTPQFVSLRW